MNMAIQNTCPSTWVNSSIVSNQSPFQAYPIPAPVERIAERLESGLTPIAFSVGSPVVTGLVLGCVAYGILSEVSVVFRKAVGVAVAMAAAGVLPGPTRVSEKQFMEINTNVAIQNTCPSTWVNSSIVPNQSPFQAYPISAPVEKIAKGLKSILLATAIFSAGAATVAAGNSVVRKAVIDVPRATVEAETTAPDETLLPGVGVGLLSVVLFLVARNAAGGAVGAPGAFPVGAFPGPPRAWG